MRMRFFLTAFVLLAPTVLYAAGFPSQLVWLSKTNIVENETVQLFTVLLNDSSTPFKGTVVFEVDEKTVSENIFELSGGASKILSGSWKATSGSHAIRARLQSGEGTTSVQAQTAAITVIVAKAPPPGAAAQVLNTAASIAQSIATTSAPFVMGVANAVYEKTELLRKEGLAYLEAYVKEENQLRASTTPRSPTANTAQSASTTGTTEPSPLSQLSQLAAAALLFTFQTPALFYPIFCFILLTAIYLLLRWATKPRY